MVLNWPFSTESVLQIVATLAIELATCSTNRKHSNEMLCGFMVICPLAPGLNFVKNSLTYFCSLFISSSALHLIAERLASVTDTSVTDTSFKVFGLTGLRIEPSLPASKANALNH